MVNLELKVPNGIAVDFMIAIESIAGDEVDPAVQYVVDQITTQFVKQIPDMTYLLADYCGMDRMPVRQVEQIVRLSQTALLGN